MKAGEALSTANSLFKAELAKKTSWGKNEVLEIWTAVLLKVMAECANDS
jgi:hypothetical protein